MALEEELRLEIERAIRGFPMSLDAATQGVAKTDAAGMLVGMVVPMLDLYRSMILRLAREIDELREA